MEQVARRGEPGGFQRQREHLAEHSFSGFRQANAGEMKVIGDPPGTCPFGSIVA
jgi:hypothetical protein